MADKQGESSTKLDAVHTRLDALAASLARIEAAQNAGFHHRVLGTLERAPSSVGVALIVLAGVLILLASHVDIVALAAAYSRSKGTP